jgi:hypothetical protein
MHTCTQRRLSALLVSCRRDLAFLASCLDRQQGAELRSTIESVMQTREHLIRALANAPGANAISGRPVDGGGNLLAFARRARAWRLEPLECAEEIENAEAALLEEIEDVILDERVGAGLRIMLERHVALARSSYDRAAALANRLRRRAARAAQDGAQAARPA